jgi:hypothetical protein
MYKICVSNKNTLILKRRGEKRGRERERKVECYRGEAQIQSQELDADPGPPPSPAVLFLFELCIFLFKVICHGLSFMYLLSCLSPITV